MKNYTPVAVLLLTSVGALITAILAANGTWLGRAGLLPSLGVVWVVIFFFVAYSKFVPSGSRPLIAPHRFGSLLHKDGSLWRKEDGSPFQISEILKGRHLGKTGLIVSNDGDTAYDIFIPKAVSIGKSRLTFGGREDRIERGKDAFFEALIEKPGGELTFGSELRDEMRANEIQKITVAVAYKDADNRWYKTLVQIERDQRSDGGLRAVYRSQRRFWLRPSSEKR